VPLPDKDNVIRLIQRNGERKVVIDEIGPEVVAIVRRGEGQLKGQEADVIFPPRVREAMEEFVDYQRDGADLAEVLRKVMRMTLVDADGHEQAVDMKIDCVDIDGYDPVFEMRVTPSEAQRATDRPISDMVRMEGAQLAMRDPQLGIPDRGSFQRYVELAHYVMNRDDSSAVVGVILVGPHPPDGVNTQLMLQVAEICRTCLRQEDVIARLDGKSLAFMLMDTDASRGAVALRRMRDALNAMNIIDSGAGVTDFRYVLAFDDMHSLDTPAEILKACDTVAQLKSPEPPEGANVIALR